MKLFLYIAVLFFSCSGLLASDLQGGTASKILLGQLRYEQGTLVGVIDFQFPRLPITGPDGVTKEYPFVSRDLVDVAGNRYVYVLNPDNLSQAQPVSVAPEVWEQFKEAFPAQL